MRQKLLTLVNLLFKAVGEGNTNLKPNSGSRPVPMTFLSSFLKLQTTEKLLLEDEVKNSSTTRVNMKQIILNLWKLILNLLSKLGLHSPKNPDQLENPNPVESPGSGVSNPKPPSGQAITPLSTESKVTPPQPKPGSGVSNPKPPRPPRTGSGTRPPKPSPGPTPPR